MAAIDLVVKIGSMALIQKAENEIDYNIFQRLGGDLRPGMILVTSGATEIGRLDYLHRAGHELLGETEEETEETLAMLRALPMTYAHVFPYSERPGTKAATLPQLPKKVRQEHAARVRNLIAEKKAAFLDVQMGLPEMWAAFDSADARHGNNEYFVDCRMEFPETLGENASATAPLGHELIKVKPLRIEKNLLIVRPA